MNANDIVAVLLALCIVMFVAGGVFKAIIYQIPASDLHAELWESIIQVIIGGLIGFMAGKK